MNKNISLRMHTLSVTMMMALLIMLAISMDACGSAGTSTPGTSTPGTSTGGSSGSTNTPAASTTGLPEAGTGKVRNCGTINIRALPQKTTSNTQAAGNCFWQAYQKCQSASLVANFTSIDTITKRTFTVEPSHTRTCHVTDVVQHSIVPRPLKTIGSYSCASISHTQQELVISACGKDGNIIIPLR